MPGGKDTLTTNEVKGLQNSKKELDKFVEEAKKTDEDAKEYKDLMAALAKKGPDIKKFLDVAEKQHVAHMERTDKAYTNVRKDLTDLVNQAKKAINAIKANKIKTEKDSLKDGHIAVLIRAKKDLDDWVGKCKKEGGEKSKAYLLILRRLAALGDVNKKIAECKSHVNKVPKTFKDYVDSLTGINKLLPLVKKAFAEILAESMAEKAKGWEVTCNSDVDAAAKEMNCVALARVMAQIKTAGLNASGLRHVSGSFYDVLCSTSKDHTWVGIADKVDKSFEFKAHFEKKKYKAGDRISPY